MIDPILSLAVSVHSNKGVYALLLGSGVSRSSGIPTGWEIVQDLIRKVAHIKGEACSAEPSVWFQETFNLPPSYSEILDQVAKSPAERGQLLRGYFEPNADEQADGQKQPTPAHRAIAVLVAKGYIRVIVTTNFDRLMEQSLADAGVQPVVISNADAALGALPLVHSRCTVVKINGDYLDTRLRNTTNELSSYEPSVDKLLDQIFDEYGLIVAGWSADWDTALCKAVERCSSRRFTTYWAQRGEVGSKARDLVALRGAVIVPIVDADSLFRDLSEKVDALASFSEADPVSARVAVARLKKYLPDAQNKIAIHDLFAVETEKVHSVFISRDFPLASAPGSITGDVILVRLRKYEHELQVLLPMAVCTAYWSAAGQHGSTLQSFRRLADQQGLAAGTVLWANLRRYPALLLLYGMGLAAIAGENYRFLKSLLLLEISNGKGKPGKTVASLIYDQKVMSREHQKVLPGRRADHTPLANHLFETLREVLREYIPDDSVYDDTFDWFEYLFCLVHCDGNSTRQELASDKQRDPDFTLWGPVGRFGWKDTEAGILQRTRLREDGEPPPNVAEALHVGFFDSGPDLNPDKYLAIKAGFDRLVEKVRREWGIYW